MKTAPNCVSASSEVGTREYVLDMVKFSAVAPPVFIYLLKRGHYMAVNNAYPLLLSWGLAIVFAWIARKNHRTDVFVIPLVLTVVVLIENFAPTFRTGLLFALGPLVVWYLVLGCWKKRSWFFMAALTLLGLLTQEMPHRR